MVGAAVAISAGIFLQIATGDLLPESHQGGTHRLANLGSFIVGIGLTLAGALVQ
jgi:zinc transporter ZupT